MHTGDLGFLEEAGFLFIRGRLKDMIVSGGQNVHAAEVEDAILLVAGVTEDAANIAILAAKRAWPDVTRDAVRQQLAKLGRFEGANGALAIDPETREVVRYGLVTIRIENGKVNYSPKL